MGSRWRSFRAPRLTLAVQQAHMRGVWPALDSRIEAGTLVVQGRVQPSPVTEVYRVRMTYRLGGPPRLHIVSPKLERRPEQLGTPIPHTYGYDHPGSETPCVYYPRSREWTPAKPLATTVMPWLLAWLVDYELWGATGEWFGGGVPHGETKPRSAPSPVEEDAA